MNEEGRPVAKFSYILNLLEKQRGCWRGSDLVF